MSALASRLTRMGPVGDWLLLRCPLPRRHCSTEPAVAAAGWAEVCDLTRASALTALADEQPVVTRQLWRNRRRRAGGEGLSGRDRWADLVDRPATTLYGLTVDRGASVNAGQGRDPSFVEAENVRSDLVAAQSTRHRVRPLPYVLARGNLGGGLMSEPAGGRLRAAAVQVYGGRR